MCEHILAFGGLSDTITQESEVDDDLGFNKDEGKWYGWTPSGRQVEVDGQAERVQKWVAWKKEQDADLAEALDEDSSPLGSCVECSERAGGEGEIRKEFEEWGEPDQESDHSKIGVFGDKFDQYQEAARRAEDEDVLEDQDGA